MAGISGAGIDRALYPNIYGPEQKMSGAYGKRAGAAAGTGSASGSAQQNFRNITAMDRIGGQQQQAAGYGQMLNQLAMLAAFMRQRQQPSMDAQGMPMEQAQPGSSESAFQTWYKTRANALGLDPNPDAKEHYYDYRAAFKSGAEPDSSGHWPSEFKLSGHPRMFVDGINTKTGAPEYPPFSTMRYAPRYEPEY